MRPNDPRLWTNLRKAQVVNLRITHNARNSVHDVSVAHYYTSLRNNLLKIAHTLKSLIVPSTGNLLASIPHRPHATTHSRTPSPCLILATPSSPATGQHLKQEGIGHRTSLHPLLLLLYTCTFVRTRCTHTFKFDCHALSPLSRLW